MSFESSPYFPLRISFSSKTGVSRVVAPWRLKTSVTVSKRRSRRAASSPVPVCVSVASEPLPPAWARGSYHVQSRVPLGTLRLKFLPALSSLPISSSMEGVCGWLQYRRRARGQWGRTAVHGTLLGMEIKVRPEYRRASAGCKWGMKMKSRISREVVTRKLTQEQTVHLRVSLCLVA